MYVKKSNEMKNDRHKKNHFIFFSLAHIKSIVVVFPLPFPKEFIPYLIYVC